MPIRLSIEADSVAEFDEMIARFANSGATSPIAATAATAATAAAEAAAPKTTRSRKAAEPTPTPTGAEAAADPFSAPDTSSAANGAASAASDTSGSETISATPAAASPTADAGAAGAEVTVQQLKDAMADLLKAKSASFAMQTLFDATGCKSLTTGSPSVVEMAKTDPGIMQTTLEALVAAKAAA